MELHMWPTAWYMRRELGHDTDVDEFVFISTTEAHTTCTNKLAIYWSTNFVLIFN